MRQSGVQRCVIRLLVVVLLVLMTLPALADTESDATRRGRNDGWADGAREASDRAEDAGYSVGVRKGESETYDRIFREEKKRAYDRGWDRGISEGRDRGEDEGSEEGESKGRTEGDAAGLRKGESDAKQQADDDAKAPGTAKGEAEAERSRATELGRNDGLLAGGREALDRAKTEDFEKGREAYRAQRMKEPVRSRDTYTIKRDRIMNRMYRDRRTVQDGVPAPGPVPSGPGLAFAGDVSLLAPPEDLLASDWDPPSPDHRYSSGSSPYTDANLANAYRRGYDSGYDDGFRERWSRVFRQGYDRGYDSGAREGRRRAEALDYADYLREGQDAGYTRGYEEAFGPARERAYKSAFASAERDAHERAYRATYPGAYDGSLEKYRKAAYDARYQALYHEAFERGRSERFNASYPRYAKEYDRKGKLAEAQDFLKRPLRIQSLQIVDPDGDGVLRPGETLQVRAVVRNFLDARFKKERIRFVLQGEELAQAETRGILTRDVQPRSVGDVSDLLRFSFSEAAATKPTRLSLRMVVGDREMDALTQDVTVTWPVALSLTPPEGILEGVAQDVNVRLRNTSTKATGPLVLSAASGGDGMEVAPFDGTTAPLAPGEERPMRVVVVGHRTRDGLGGTLEVSVADEHGTRQGVLRQEVRPLVLGDCTLDYVFGKLALRDVGDHEVRFQVTGRTGSSEAIHVRAWSEMAVVQVLSPEDEALPAAGTQRLVVKVRTHTANQGGAFFIELKQAGHVLLVRKVTW